MRDAGWQWDPSLYAGSAAFSPRGRMRYPDALVTELDGRGRLLDVGCGPGSLTGVAALLHGLLSADGALVHVHAATHEGVDDGPRLTRPRPPRREIAGLLRHFLGPNRRAGQGTLPPVGSDGTASGRVEAEAYRGAGFVGPTRLEVAGPVVGRDADDVVVSVFSLSFAAPHLFGERLAEFEAALRRLLADASPDGRFSGQMGTTVADVWRR